VTSKIQKYIDRAMRPGVQHVVAVEPDDIVFDGRTLLKCMFGCNSWEKGPTCPSKQGFLKPWEWEPLLRKYKTVLIIHTHDKKTAQDAAFSIEREAFLDGDVLAFSMSDCAICNECAGKKNKECKDKTRARPALHSVGIDVFATVSKLKLPLKPLRDEHEQQNWYSAVWLN